MKCIRLVTMIVEKIMNFSVCLVERREEAECELPRVKLASVSELQTGELVLFANQRTKLPRKYQCCVNLSLFLKK